MYKARQVFTAIIITLSIAACSSKWEYRVVQFDRDDYASGMEEVLNELGKDKWEYAGPLSNNGMNAKYIAFKRKL